MVLHALDHAHRAASGRDDKPGAYRLAGAHLHPRTTRRHRAFQEYLDATARRLAAEQARRYHARVVEDQQVFRSKQIREVNEMPVGDGASGAVEGEQAARGTLRQGRLGDQLRRQLKVEIFAAHGGRAWYPMPPRLPRLRPQSTRPWPRSWSSSSRSSAGMMASKLCALRSRCTRSVNFSPSP